MVWGWLKFWNDEATILIAKMPVGWQDKIKLRNRVNVRKCMCCAGTVKLEGMMDSLTKDLDNFKAGTLFLQGKSGGFATAFGTAEAKAKEIYQSTLSFQACVLVLNKVEQSPSNIVKRLHGQCSL